MYWPNLKSVAFPIPEIIGGTRQNWAVHGYAHTPFSKIFNGLLFGWTLLMVQPNLKSLAFPVPENEIIGGTQKLGSPWIRPRSLFSKYFNMLLFGWNPLMYWPNLKSVAFPVPEIIGGSRKIVQSLGTPTLPLIQKF